MEQRLINWRASAMKPVIQGSYLMILWNGPTVKNDKVVGVLIPTMFIVTRVSEDGTVYGIESID